MSESPGLFALETPPDSRGFGGNYGQGTTELETRAAIAEIEEDGPLKGARRMTKQLCISLAMSIDKGNMKGRAIANEAAQLFQMMQQLSPLDAGADGPELTYSPELERLFNVFASGPTLETDPDLDAAPEGNET